MFLILTLLLVVPGICLSIAAHSFLHAFILCGLAGLPTLIGGVGLRSVLKDGTKGDTVEDMLANGCLTVLITGAVFFFFGMIVAPINIIRFVVGIGSLSGNINDGETRMRDLRQLMADAEVSNEKAAIAAQREAAARAGEQQRLEQERQAMRRKAEEDRKQANDARRQQFDSTRGAVRNEPRQELYAVALIDAGPYRRDVVEELNKITGRRPAELVNGTDLVKGLPKEKADEIVATLAFLGAQVEAKRH